MKSLVALDDISLEISEPGIYGFVGPNGSGKSLIFKTILGFLKPDSGQVFVHGKKLRKDVLFAEDTGYSMVEYAALADKTGRQNLELMDILASEKHDLDKLFEICRARSEQSENVQGILAWDEAALAFGDGDAVRSESSDF